MKNCEPLAWYGAMVLLLVGALIAVPYLRRKGDLVSAWNLLLIGIAIFLGLGCFEAVYSPIRFHGQQWFEPTRKEVNWFMLANTIFLIALLTAHYLDPLPRKLSESLMSKWPPITTRTIFYVLIACAPLIFASYFARGITFLGPFFVNVSHKAVVFITVFSFALWYRNRLNPLWLCLFIGSFIAACLFAALAAGGRRLILTVCLGPTIYLYMATVRHWRPSRGAVAMAGLGCLLLIVAMIYSTVRHYDRGRWSKSEGRSAAGLIEGVKDVNKLEWYDRFASDQLFFFSQQVVHYSLLTNRFISMGTMEVRPFNTFKFLAVYPIPRRIYPGKPQQLGAHIVHDIVGARTTWGCGVAGHAAFEGGLLLAAMFGYMGAFGTKLFDTALQRQPDNPFLIAMLASASMHLIAWPRGDIGTMTVESMEAYFFALALGIGGRFLFGTERNYQGSRKISYATTLLAR